MKVVAAFALLFLLGKSSAHEVNVNVNSDNSFHPKVVFVLYASKCFYCFSGREKGGQGLFIGKHSGCDLKKGGDDIYQTNYPQIPV